MTGSPGGTTRPEETPAGITTRDILVLFLPLAATSTMMSVSTPVINAGLARLPHPEINLAAFGLAFTLGIFLESPVFSLQQAVVAWYGGKGPLRPLVSFALGVGILVMAWEGAIAFTPAAPFILQRLLGADRELTGPAVHALRLSILFPPLVAVRSVYQAVLITRRRATPIAVGTFVRLVFLALCVFLVMPRLGWEGPAVAVAALAGAVLVETFYTIAVTLRTVEVDRGGSPAQTAGRKLRGRVLFLVPLAWTMTLSTLTNPLINAFIARAEDPKVGLAVFSVVASLVWFMASSVLRYSSITIALGTNPANRARLRSFLWRFVGGLCTGILLVVLTPARDLLLQGLIGLTPELARRAHLPLILLSLQPLVAGFIAYNQGALTRSARTHLVGFGSLSRAAIIVGLGMAGLALHMRGELLGGILLGAAFAAELATLLVLTGATRRSLSARWRVLSSRRARGGDETVPPRP